MLEGITVLNQEMIIGIQWYAAFIPAAGALIVVLGFAFMARYGDYNTMLWTVGLSMFLGGAITIAVGLVCPPEIETGRYRYEVTIDESVSFNDIYERYEIVEQRGDIWVLEEKENVSE